MGYQTKIEINAAQLAPMMSLRPTFNVTRIDVAWCELRNAVNVRLFSNSEEVTYFLCHGRVTLDDVRSTLRRVVFGHTHLDGADIFVGGRRYHSGFLSTQEALVRAINATTK